ncbi:MAG TPA: NAD(P)-dependent alcohol dehydrogenase, partial [Thermoanaerobaculia bacterium]
MKAVVCRRYGSVDCEEAAMPACGDDQLLIRVRAASINARDAFLVKGSPPIVRLIAGLRRPRNPRVVGTDAAGVVESIGRNVTRFKVGDEVFGLCRGAVAEYACMAESAAAAKPANVSFEQAAAIPVAGLTALQSIRDKAQVREGESVLVNGAAGGVGSFAVQIAKSFGANVTGVCNARNVDLVRAYADRVIDYTRDDFTKLGERWDVVIDCYSTRTWLAAYKRVLKPGGRYLIIGGAANAVFGLLFRFVQTLFL